MGGFYYMIADGGRRYTQLSAYVLIALPFYFAKYKYLPPLRRQLLDSPLQQGVAVFIMENMLGAKAYIRRPADQP